VNEHEGAGGISFVCPACNEATHIAATLGELHGEISRQGYPFEMILIDDGSTDATLQRLHEVAATRPHVRVLSNPGNRGLGWSIRRGLAEARHDYVMFVPTNGMLDPRSTFADLGDRAPDVAILFYPDNHHVRPLNRRVISRAYQTLTTSLFGLKGVPYVHGMLLLPRARVRVEELRADRSFLVFELLVHALARWGLRPIVKRNRVQRAESLGGSKSLTLQNAWALSKDLLDLRLRLSRKRS
jgi:glycosyltransferase involved in cell wall biosynthesis